MASKRRPSRGSDAIVEPNMTPLIDVSLVLVVILMVATPLAFQSSIAINTASRAGKQAAEMARTERIELFVHADGTIGVNRLVVPREALGVTLKPLIEQSATRMVVVRCDDEVPHGAFVGVLDEAKSVGAARIAVVGS
ncbi:MAG: biopolymer transporter ExbD [Candidatus Eisenbacteria bacterium]|uniref:Biopolymer transporter ExbD n=1 Tax=Eiseniibacteriota bacterium TaxID=2212470 RepID=A0A538TIB7_UNCEI|nr:MAG: biopolymer transporter ExbD [Candidatus Eisenbacteria bacterium]